MSHLQQSSSIEETPDLPTQFTTICHLMTWYAIRPCETIAVNINRHMEILLISSAADPLGDWHSSIQQLYKQWAAIAARHVQQQAAMAEANRTVSH